jgi:hypothetical protein
MSAPLRGTEVHGEFALFDTAGGPIAAALAGTSYRVPLGNGLLVFAEYRYHGDARVPSPHAIAVLGSYEYGPTLSASAHYLQSVVDGSGVFIPSATVTCNDRLSLVFTGYVPHGAAPAGSTVRSAFRRTRRASSCLPMEAAAAGSVRAISRSPARSSGADRRRC